MKNVLKSIIAVSSMVLLVGCVEESFTSEYYGSDAGVYYSNETTGYNRDYNRHHHKPNRYYPAPTVNSGGSYPTGSGNLRPSGRNSDGYNPTGSGDLRPSGRNSDGYNDLQGVPAGNNNGSNRSYFPARGGFKNPKSVSEPEKIAEPTSGYPSSIGQAPTNAMPAVNEGQARLGALS